MKRLNTALIGATGLLSLSLGAQTLQVPADMAAQINSEKSAVYIVQLADDPIVAYEGDVKGLAATRPDKGKRINPKSAAVRKYRDFLQKKQGEVLDQIGGGTLVYNYEYSFNGFAAVISDAQAEALRQQPGVAAVWRDELRQPTTDTSGEFLGLNAPGTGVWELGFKGEDVIVGVIDTGIWPEHPSFSDQLDLSDAAGNSGKRNLAYGPAPAHWQGVCQSGEQFSQNDCNNKLIGARYFLNGFTHSDLVTQEFHSARDSDGHGSHTAGTAAGNAGVSASILGSDLGVISGVAPRARVAAYKVCWNDEGCASSDLVEAIDTAVADGVDVINYSIGGSATDILTPDAISFLFAADAGVYVATSAGNSGPGAATVGNPAIAPWVTTVGASTHSRTFEGAVTLANGLSLSGASLTGGTDLLPLVDAANAGDELCLPGSLNPALVAGKIVLCKRGAIARVEKSLAVQMAGGVGMVLYNANDAESQVTDNHYLPSVHISNTQGLQVLDYLAIAGDSAQAQIVAGQAVSIDAPSMAAFSSRGPNLGSLDLIKPDVTAPGVNILAAGTPTPYLGAQGELFMAISGTSMSSPHVAGALALLKEAHPEWSAAEAKSALMTTAYQQVKKEGGSTDADAFDMGAGHIDVTKALNPGLVYDADLYDYFGFLCDVSTALDAATCDFLAQIGYPTEAANLNLASIGVGQLAGLEVVQRRVTNVSGIDSVYNVSVDAPAGLNIEVYPSTLALAAGETATYSVIITNVDAEPEQWTFGSLTWTDGEHVVYSPLAVRPVALGVATNLELFGATGSASTTMVFGYGGDYQATVHGLTLPSTEAGHVVDDPANDINTALATGVGYTLHVVNINEGTALARFSLFDDATDGEDDLDLYVFSAAGEMLGGSGSGTSAEQVDLLQPAAGTYFVIVHAWQADGADANYTLYSWQAGSDQGNLTVDAPDAAVLGQQVDLTLSWDLTESGRYLGAIVHQKNDEALAVTQISVDAR